MTFGQLHGRFRWLLPVVATFFVVVAVLARVRSLPWDLSITRWIADNRTARWNDFFGTATNFGAYKYVAIVTIILAVVAWFRSRALAVAIVLLALVSPLLVALLKALIGRPRPPLELALNQQQPGGFSFPSGHPLAVAASWGFIPLVVGLYTRRRWIFWTTVVVVWSMVAVIGASRVYLGAHYATDVAASLSLAILFVAGSEVVIDWTHDRHHRLRYRRHGPTVSETASTSRACDVEGSGGSTGSSRAPGRTSGAASIGATR